MTRKPYYANPSKNFRCDPKESSILKKLTAEKKDISKNMDKDLARNKQQKKVMVHGSHCKPKLNKEIRKKCITKATWRG
jgi:hypothetical protein